MKNMTAELNQNGIHYTLHGDYYLPDLELPEKASAPLGRYGRMRKAYIEEHCPGLYESGIESCSDFVYNDPITCTPYRRDQLCREQRKTTCA